VVAGPGGATLALFASEHALRWAAEDHPHIAFAELGLSRAT
jgi:hypothetical protein